MTGAPGPLPAGYPELRPGPPWVMAEMIGQEPSLAAAVLGEHAGPARLAKLLESARDRGQQVAVVGCGSSEHAAMGVARLLARSSELRLHPRAALDAALDPWPGVCLGISHEGETQATLAALRAAALRGAATALVTAVGGAPATRAAGLVLTTPTVDRSWCHTVGYISPLLVGLATAAALAGREGSERAVGEYLGRCLQLMRHPARAAARVLAPLQNVTCVGSGCDLASARELALKVAEGARQPALAHELETLLHGHLAAVDQGSAVVVFLTDPDRGPRLLRRGRQLLAAASRVGATTVLVAGPFVPLDYAPEVRPNRLDVPSAEGAPALVPALLGSALALQLLALELAVARGTNPDLIRREQAPYREAAQLTRGDLGV